MHSAGVIRSGQPMDMNGVMLVERGGEGATQLAPFDDAPVLKNWRVGSRPRETVSAGTSWHCPDRRVSSASSPEPSSPIHSIAGRL